MTMDLRKLAEPFPASDVEWRVQSAGKKGDKVWARVLAYITNRAIMERLDDVCGPENWRNEYVFGPNGAVLCGISIRYTDADGYTDWITKWDGAENTDIEAVKGGLSNAMKRCGVQWGIGRYLYELEEGYAKVHENGTNYQSKKDGKYDAFKWDPPELPKWALPGGSGKPGGSRSAAGSRRDAAAGSKEDGGRIGTAAPSVAPTPSTAEQKPWVFYKVNDRSMDELSDEELQRYIESRSGEAQYVSRVKAARALLDHRKDTRSPDEIVRRMQDQEDAFQSTLPG